MYTLRHLREGMRRPDRFAYELNRLCHTRGWRRTRNPRGTNVLDEDWDNLVILDACRYDLFAERSTLPGSLGHRYSVGSATKQFVTETFAGRRLHDTVYVGANTWFLKLRDEIETEVHHFVDLQNGEYDVEWVDEELRVVTPETVTRHARRIHEEFPNKRLIVHYLQPHHPFIGPTGRRYLSYQTTSLRDVVRQAGPEVDRDVVRRAYVETLDLVLETVGDLLPDLAGRTVVTADHGEMLGERFRYVPIRGFGHPEGVYNEYTTKVPWNVVEAETRKEVVAEEPLDDVAVDTDAIDEQLRHLGYVV